VEGRINALARVHTILSLSSWRGAEIGRLVADEMAPYASGTQVRASGPELSLQPATAQTLALVLHELLTNSAKYGALSTLLGQLSIRWQTADEILALTWEETGGPLVREPTTRGFGTRGIVAGIEAQLGGKVAFDWRPEGLVCRLQVPVTEHASVHQRSDRYDSADGARQSLAR
jgi:two-component sensor histidine kinase